MLQHHLTWNCLQCGSSNLKGGNKKPLVCFPPLQIVFNTASQTVESIHGDLMRLSCCHRAWKSSSKKVSPWLAEERSLDLNGTNWKQLRRLQCISKSLQQILATFLLAIHKHSHHQLSSHCASGLTKNRLEGAIVVPGSAQNQKCGPLMLVG